MALPVPKPVYTAEQYLALERQAQKKSEFINGQIIAMTGASRKHNLITTNIARELSSQLKGRRCETYVNDMRVKVDQTGMYTYPDIVVACGDITFDDRYKDTLLNPILILEVLSSSTEAYDRGTKFAHYRRIPSLQEYVLVSQDRVAIEHFKRHEDAWILTDAYALEQSIPLPSISCTLLLSEVYDKIEWDDSPTQATPDP